MTPLTTVLFDLDGTLIDSVRLILDSYHHTMAAHGLPERTDDEWLVGLGTPLRVQFGPWAADQATMDALVATYRDYNLGNHDLRVTAYPGVVRMVDALRARGLKTGLVTSKNRTGAERGLQVVGLASTMDVLVGADDVVNPKPHPEPVLKALDTLGVDPRQAIYVGDSTHDMHSGRAAGVRTAAVLWGPFGRETLAPTAPDHWLDSPHELVTLVDSLHR